MQATKVQVDASNPWVDYYEEQGEWKKCWDSLLKPSGLREGP